MYICVCLCVMLELFKGMMPVKELAGRQIFQLYISVNLVLKQKLPRVIFKRGLICNQISKHLCYSVFVYKNSHFTCFLLLFYHFVALPRHFVIYLCIPMKTFDTSNPVFQQNFHRLFTPQNITLGFVGRSSKCYTFTSLISVRQFQVGITSSEN